MLLLSCATPKIYVPPPSAGKELSYLAERKCERSCGDDILVSCYDTARAPMLPGLSFGCAGVWAGFYGVIHVSIKCQCHSKNKPKAGEKEWMSEPASSHEEGSSPCRKSWVLPKSYFHCSQTPAIWIWQRQSKATRRLRFVNEKSRHRDDVSVKLNMRWAAICHRPFLFPILAY